MEHLSHQLWERGIHFDSADHKIPCFPHIVNACVQHILEKFHDTDLSRAPSEWQSGNTTVKRKDYAAALTLNPVQRGRDLVQMIRSSGQRREGFQKTITVGNQHKSFHDSHGMVITLPNVELLYDANTRWDSSFVMFNRLRTLRQVSQYLTQWSL